MTNDWIPCREDTEIPDIDYGCVIIAYWMECDDKWCYWPYDKCPYGWNVLCRSTAYWQRLDEPIR